VATERKTARMGPNKIPHVKKGTEGGCAAKGGGPIPELGVSTKKLVGVLSQGTLSPGAKCPGKSAAGGGSNSKPMLKNAVKSS